MSFKSRINVYRRKITHWLTYSLGKKSVAKMQKKAEHFKVDRVLISRPNHRLGNMLLITPLVQEICATYPNCTIDLFVKGKIASIVFQNYPQVDRFIELPKKPFDHLLDYIGCWISLKKVKYDLIINVEKGSSSGRLSTIVARGDFKFFGDSIEDSADKHADNAHYAKYPVYNFRGFLESLNQTPLTGEVPTLDLKLSDEEISRGKRDLEEVTKDSSRKTIAFFTFATGEKCYSEEWWSDFYELFNAEFKEEFNLIEILPVENISKLNHRLPEFYSKDIREIGALMANCDLLLAADSGMMHLSCASLSPTIGLFSYTPIEMYGAYGGNNSSINTKTHSQSDIIKEMRKIVSKS
ncbi:MAG: glycosyltransferase family 9 protein [Weeksellaceae bacterium]